MTSLKDYFSENSFLYKQYNLLPALLSKYYTNMINKEKKDSWYITIRKIAKKLIYSFRLFGKSYFTHNNFKNNKMDLSNIKDYNFYVINFLPSDGRHFFHIHNIFMLDPKGVVLTTSKKTFLYYKTLKKPVIFFFVKKGRNIRKNSNDNPKVIENLDFEDIHYLQYAMNLIDLLEEMSFKYGIPKVVISLQDFHFYDYVFTEFFKKKTYTITLQHGITSTELRDNSLWNFVFSDYIIVWGKEDKENLEKLGIQSQKIIPLGTARYDHYFRNYNENDFNLDNSNRILLSIQPINLLDSHMIEYIIELIKNFEKMKNIELLIRFHPGNRKYYIRQFLRKLKRSEINNFKVSKERDVVKDILSSKIILANKSGIAYDAMLFNKAVIEYNSNDENSFKKYRSAVLNFEKIEDILKAVSRILVDQEYNNKILEKQKKFIEDYFILPPNGKKILNFINNLNRK